MRPRIGQIVNLVYRECPCGWWCMTGEGHTAPICPSCGDMAVPLGGFETPDATENPLGRRQRSLGVIGLFTNEIAGVELLSRARSLFGIGKSQMVHGDLDTEHPPYGLKGEAAWLNFRMKRGFAACETLEEVHQALKLLFRFGSRERTLSLSDDEIVRLWDLTRPARDGEPIKVPFTVVSPFGVVTIQGYARHLSDGKGGWTAEVEREVKRCSCDPTLPVDADLDLRDPACPRHGAE